MFHVLSDLNWIAIVAAAVASFVVGGLWFTVVCGRAYAFALGKPYDAKAKPALIFLVGSFVCGSVTTIATAILVKTLKIESLVDALALGAIVGFGYLASTSVNTAINPNMPRPLFYGLISGG